MLTDFHSHILPAIDDGSRSVEESLAMLRKEAEQGITRVVATPHFYAHNDNPERFLKRRANAYELLQYEMEKEANLPRMKLGAEVYYFAGMSDSDVLPSLAISGSNYILVEMPGAPWTEPMYKELMGIYEKQNLVPIIAHLDRYIRPFHSHGIPERLARLPVLVQVNSSFFSDRSTTRMALRMLNAGLIHLIGSDCHNLLDRAPNMEFAIQLIQRKLGPDTINRIRAHESEVLGHE